jgi:hypothetical protein
VEAKSSVLKTKWASVGTGGASDATGYHQGEKGGRALFRRILLVLTVAAMMAMITVTMVGAAFAQPGGSENSCGKANPDFPAKNNLVSECGVENNPNYPDKPEGF